MPRAGRSRRRSSTCIERAATAANPRLRWPVGPTSFSGGRLRAFCPDRLYEWLMRIAFPDPRSPRMAAFDRARYTRNCRAVRQAHAQGSRLRPAASG